MCVGVPPHGSEWMAAQEYPMTMQTSRPGRKCPRVGTPSWRSCLPAQLFESFDSSAPPGAQSHPVDPMDKSHKDPKVIDLNVPRHAQYLHNAWKRHQDAVYWVDINLAIEKGLTFYQTRSNAIILQETLPAYCIPKIVRMKTGEGFYDKV